MVHGTIIGFHLASATLNHFQTCLYIFEHKSQRRRTHNTKPRSRLRIHCTISIKQSKLHSTPALTVCGAKLHSVVLDLQANQNDFV